jgi:uncharacterized protein (DUF2235 family)
MPSFRTRDIQPRRKRPATGRGHCVRRSGAWELHMPKNIVFCADGTWNGPEEQTHVNAVEGDDTHGESGAQITNVVKLFANLSGSTSAETLSLRDEQERMLVDRNGRVVQVAKYMHGVGDSSNLVRKVLGGVFGMGIIARIVRGYTFVSRYYEPGDDIYIVGFSRGAYTARALGGMISSAGLLNRATYDPKDKQEAYRLGLAVWCKYKGVTLAGVGKLNDIANHLLGFIGGLFARQLPKDGLITNVPVKCIGVWDTVGSLGIPVYAADGRYDIFRFSDTALSPKVERGFHAMAIDELRADFPATRWDERTGVRQVWFSGAHSDVGGGYGPDQCGLSDVALDWMLRHLHELGLQLSSPLTHVPDTEHGDQAIHAPWAQFPFSKLLHEPRSVRATDIIHESVARRWDADTRYRPAALGAYANGGLAALRRES